MQTSYSLDAQRCCNEVPVFTWHVSHPHSFEKAPVMVRAKHLVNGKIDPQRFREEDQPDINLKAWKKEEWLAQEKRGGGKGKRFTFTRGADIVNFFLVSPYGVDFEDEYRANPYRVPVEVLFDTTFDALVWPRIITVEGTTLYIDELHRVEQGANQEAGIQGVRFICSIGDRILQLYLDGLFWVVSKAELEFVLAGIKGR